MNLSPHLISWYHILSLKRSDYLKQYYKGKKSLLILQIDLGFSEVFGR